jgi:ribosomal protein S18 acetylase RimI-like enzyme
VDQAAVVVVRPATTEDAPATLDLFDQLDRFQHEWRVFEPRPTLRDEAETRFRAALTDPDMLHVVAEVDRQVVGMALGKALVVSSMSNEVAVELSGVIVRDGDRDRGIGRALVAEVGRWAAERGVRRVVIKTYSANEEALRFWRRLGFEPRLVQMTALAEELAAGS